MSPKFIGQIGTKDIDGFGEKYAEVRITQTLDTKEEMLQHIDWMVSKANIDEPLRPVEPENGGFGDWEVLTTQQLGFSNEFLTYYVFSTGSRATQTTSTSTTRTSESGQSTRLIDRVDNTLDTNNGTDTQDTTNTTNSIIDIIRRLRQG